MTVTNESDALLRLQDVSKSFGAVCALKEVSFSISRGETIALLGDNGAGKSTLIKIISGNVRPDSGRLFFNNREVQTFTPFHSRCLGIETVYQDLSLCNNVDVVANFFMGRELTRKFLFIRFLDEKRMAAETRRALTLLQATIPDIHARVDKLSGGQRQAIELCRFVHWGGSLVILDEPFAALGVQQTARGLELIEKVKKQGVAVIIITHNIMQAFQVADRCIILRQSRVTGNKQMKETTYDEVVSLMV